MVILEIRERGLYGIEEECGGGRGECSAMWMDGSEKNILFCFMQNAKT